MTLLAYNTRRSQHENNSMSPVEKVSPASCTSPVGTILQYFHYRPLFCTPIFAKKSVTLIANRSTCLKMTNMPLLILLISHAMLTNLQGGFYLPVAHAIAFTESPSVHPLPIVPIISSHQLFFFFSD